MGALGNVHTMSPADWVAAARNLPYGLDDKEKRNKFVFWAPTLFVNDVSADKGACFPFSFGRQSWPYSFFFLL